jgi:hypothetical protein
VSEPLWKQTERRVARFLGGEVTERIGRKGVDVQTDWLAIEIKTRKKLPEWIVDAVAYARAHAGDGKLGIAVLHEVGSHDDLVVLSIHDFRIWFGELHRKVGE